jgi:RimJ/RimL family protein N-acetyltransferase
MPGHPTWTVERREAFMAFFRPMLRSPGIAIYAVMAGGAMAGFMRLKRMDPPDTAETGIWLGRSHRGKGTGAAALRLLLEEAGKQGYCRVVADTTVGNLAAQSVLRRGRAAMRQDGDKIYAEMVIDPGYAIDLDK